MLVMVFELPYSIASGCFDVVDAGRHQLVNYPINQNIAVCGWKNRFYSLLGQCPFVVVGKLAAKVNVKSESAIVVNSFYPVKCSVIVICLANFHYRRFTVLNHTINDFIESRATVCRFTIKRFAVNTVYQFLKLLLPKLFFRTWWILTPPIITLIYDIAIKVIEVRIQ